MRYRNIIEVHYRFYLIDTCKPEGSKRYETAIFRLDTIKMLDLFNSENDEWNQCGEVTPIVEFYPEWVKQKAHKFIDYRFNEVIETYADSEQAKQGHFDYCELGRKF